MNERTPRLWKHIEPSQVGDALVLHQNETRNCKFEAGIVTTGRQRVFSAYYVRVDLPDGSSRRGEHRDGPVQALRHLSCLLKDDDMHLIAAGLDERFYESGLSAQSSWGYLHGEDRAFHMMEVPRATSADRQGPS